MPDTFNRFSGARSTYGVKKPVRAATTENITLSGFQTIDEVTFASADESAGYNMRCLVKDQADSTTNGIYLVNSGDWTREKDFDGNTDICEGTRVYVARGTVNGGREFFVSSADPQDIDSSGISFIANPGSWYAIGKSAEAVPLAGTTAETILATIAIPAGAMGENGVVRVTSLHSNSTSTGSKSLRVRFNGTAFETYATTTTPSCRVQTQIANRNSESSQVGGVSGGTGGWATSTSTVITSTHDTSSALNITITGQLASTGASESMQLEYYLAEILHG